LKPFVPLPVIDETKKIIMKKRFFSFFAVSLLTAILFTACNNSGEKKPAEDTTKKMTEEPVMDAPKDVVDIAIGSADHSTLVTAVTAAGLVETLKGAGPFTIFAPTNTAFDALPAGTVTDLLKAENKAKLTNILTYHVVAGNVKAADLKDGQKVKTLQGEELAVSIKDGKVMINGSNVTTADLAGSNGVIHVIDAVLMPKK
jgi:uncharacterized surface protein with fasciclin (FAS1) repeats